MDFVVRFSDVAGTCEEDVLLVEDEEVEDDMLVELDVCEKGVVDLEELADDKVVGDIVGVVVTSGEELDGVFVLIREEDREEGRVVVTFVVPTEGICAEDNNI